MTGGLAPPLPILVLRALGLGDALAAVPALRGLRRAFPAARLLLAADGPPARLLAGHGLVDGVVPCTGLAGDPPGASLGPHVAVNLHGRGPESHRLLLAGRPSRLIAYGCPAAGVPGPAWQDPEHEVERWCRLVRWAGGPCSAADLLLEPPSGVPAGVRAGLHAHAGRAAHPSPRPALRSLPRTGPVVVHPGASAADRRWPVPRFAAVARALAAAGHPVVVTGSAAEARRCAQVAANAGLPGAAELAGLLDLPELTGLLRHSRLLVCGDTGVAHLATAVRTPSVVLFGPVPPSRWAPAVDADRHRVIWHGTPVPRPARRSGADPSLLRITVTEVLSACAEVLPAVHAGTSRMTP